MIINITAATGHWSDTRLPPTKSLCKHIKEVITVFTNYWLRVRGGVFSRQVRGPLIRPVMWSALCHAPRDGWGPGMTLTPGTSVTWS